MHYAPARRFVTAIMLAAGFCLLPHAARADSPTKLTLGIGSWLGFAPLFIAKQKGFFAAQGIDVDLERIETAGDRRSAFAAGRIDGFPTTVDTHVMSAAAGIAVKMVLALDDSYGGDGIVVKKDIASLKDLAGRTIAVETDGGASYFWFLYILSNAGVDPSRIHFQSMDAGSAGSAFVAGKVDGAVTWQPWLGRAEETSFGKLLESSAATPGIICDTLGMRTAYVHEHPGAIRALVKAWYQSIAYINANRADAYAIMAATMGQKADTFAEQAKGVRWYDRSTNRTYFGTPQRHGKLYGLTKSIGAAWVKYKLIPRAPSVDDMVDGTYI